VSSILQEVYRADTLSYTTVIIYKIYQYIKPFFSYYYSLPSHLGPQLIALYSQRHKGAQVVYFFAILISLSKLSMPTPPTYTQITINRKSVGNWWIEYIIDSVRLL